MRLSTFAQVPPPTPSSTRGVTVPPPPQPVRDLQTENVHRLRERIAPAYLSLLCVFGALAVLYVSWSSSSAPGSEEQCSSIAHLSIWVTIAFIVSLAVVAVNLYDLAVQLPNRPQRSESQLPSIRVVREPETSATSSRSRTPVAAVPGTLRPPDLQHPPESARLEESLASQPPRPISTEYPTAGMNRHVIDPVEQIPRRRAWLQEATGHGPVINPSRSATWNPASDGPLLRWTLFLPVDPRMFGRVRKQPQTHRPIFSSPNCDVFKCEIEFIEPSALHPDKAAVKVVRRYVQNEHDPIKVLERINARLYQEAVTWAGVHHPNTVPLLGVIFSPVHALVLPWYRFGNLRTYLAHYPGATKLKLINDIARALEHLHSRNPIIVQADIKPENVLINDQGDALITDFGMATVLGEDDWYTPSHLHGGTMQWMAPEILLGQSDKRSRTGDVYSFASLTCYIMTGRMPHASRSIYQIVSTLNGANGSPEPIERWHVHPEFQDRFGGLVSGIIRRCWSRVPSSRPLMETVVRELSSLIQERESLVFRC